MLHKIKNNHSDVYFIEASTLDILRYILYMYTYYICVYIYKYIYIVILCLKTMQYSPCVIYQDINNRFHCHKTLKDLAPYP